MDNWENEFRVKEHVRSIIAIEGGWETLRDVMWTRRMVLDLRRAREAAQVTREEISGRTGIPLYRITEIEDADLPDADANTLMRWTEALDSLVVPQVSEVCS